MFGFSLNKDTEIDSSSISQNGDVIAISTCCDKIATAFLTYSSDLDEVGTKTLFVSQLGETSTHVQMKIKECAKGKEIKLCWSPDSSKIIAFAGCNMQLFDTKTGEQIGLFSQEVSQSQFLEAFFFSDDLVLVSDVKGYLSALDSKFNVIEQTGMPSAITAFGKYDDKLLIGTEKGKVMFYNITDETIPSETEGEEPKRTVKFECTNEIWASGSPIKVLAIRDDNLFVSALSDTIMWSSTFRPVYAIKTKSHPVLCEQNIQFGFSYNDSSVFMHKLVKGSKEETQKEVHSADDIVVGIDFHWVDENNIKLFVADGNTIIVYLLTRQNM